MTVAIELATSVHDELLALKAATRERLTNPVEALAGEIASEPYTVGGDTVRYILRWSFGLRNGSGWKGRWYVGWSPIGENALLGRYRGM